jgi:dihydrodipicolinate synthase/N-acetylneuraminate lyase
MERQLLFQGTATAIVTPFKKDGSVDETALREFVEFQIKGGIEALVPAGSTESRSSGEQAATRRPGRSRSPNR